MSQRRDKKDGRPALMCGVIAAALLAGCVNGQKEVQSYREVLDGPSATQPGTRPSTQPATLPATLSLEQALQLANSHNDQLMISGEDYVQALIAKARAEGTFLPNVSFQPSFLLQKPFPYPSLGPGGPSSAVFSQFAPQHANDGPINTNLSTSLVRDIYEVSRAGHSIEERRALLLDLQSTIFLNVARSYYDILEAEQSVETLSSSVRVQEERVANVSRRAQQGVARRLDVLQSQADAAATRVQLTDARNRVANGRATLGMLLGRDPIGVPLVDHFAPAKVDDEAVLLKTARANRQDLVAAAADVRASAAALKSAWGEYYPSIGMNLNTFLYRESFPQDSWWTALFTINLPIFEEGIIHQNVRNAYSKLRQSANRALQVDHQIAADVHSAYADYQASVQRLADLQTEVDASKRAYEAAVHAFDVGTATNLDVLTAQNSQLNSELLYDNERYNLKVTYLAALRLTGKLDRAAIAQLAEAPHAAATATAPATGPAIR